MQKVKKITSQTSFIKGININKLICIFAGVFILFTILMKSSTDVLNESAYNILHFEFLWNYNKYELIVSTWSAVEINSAITNTWLDFGWLIGYGGLIITLNYKLSKNFQLRLKKLIIFAIYSGIIAMSLDIMENIILLNLLYQSKFVFSSMPLIGSIIASLKFIFVFCGIFIYIMQSALLIKKTSGKKHRSSNNEFES